MQIGKALAQNPTIDRSSRIVCFLACQNKSKKVKLKIENELMNNPTKQPRPCWKLVETDYFHINSNTLTV